MNLTNKSEIKSLLKKYNAKPEKYLGQHFILSKNALKKMVGAAEIPHPLKKGRGLNEIIVEIGPGLGTLTVELAKTGARVIAIEKDPLMIKILNETLIKYENLKVIQADARQIPLLSIPSILRVDSFGDKMWTMERSKYKIVANLPYNAATFLIRRWLESENPPQTMVLMIQKEVARRIIARPPHSNILSISAQFYADAKIIDYVKKESFWPRPKVDAAIIKIIPKKATPFRRSLEKQQFFKILKAGFSSPRKQLMGNLSRELNLQREKLTEIFRNLSISSAVRAENLDLKDWEKIASILSTSE